jgi:hypothetical protein
MCTGLCVWCIGLCVGCCVGVSVRSNYDDKYHIIPISNIGAKSLVHVIIPIASA